MIPSPLSFEYIATPVGPLLLIGSAERLHAVKFLERGEEHSQIDSLRPHLPAPLRTAELEPGSVQDGAARIQLEEYFSGNRRAFDLALALHGTPYQVEVWHHMMKIPFGQTWSYGRLAESIGGTHPRAVGGANHANPIPIIIPCHRVVGHDGSLVGFGGGLERKRWLLEHESTRDPLHKE